MFESRPSAKQRVFRIEVALPDALWAQELGASGQGLCLWVKTGPGLSEDEQNKLL